MLVAAWSTTSAGNAVPRTTGVQEERRPGPSGLAARLSGRYESCMKHEDSRYDIHYVLDLPVHQYIFFTLSTGRQR
jgi:hypothetical protein